MARCEERAPWRGHRRCDMDHEYENVNLTDGYRVHGYRSSRRHGITVTWLKKPALALKFCFIELDDAPHRHDEPKGTVIVSQITIEDEAGPLQGWVQAYQSFRPKGD